MLLPFLFYNRGSKDIEGNERDANCSLPVVDENLEESDPYIFNCDSSDIIVVPAEDASSSKDQKVSRSPQENKKSNAKKRLRKLTSKKAVNQSNPMSRADNSNNPQDLSSSTTDDDGDRQGLERKITSNEENSNTATGDKSSLDHEPSGLNNSVESSKKGQQKRNFKRSPSSEIGAEKGKVNAATLKSKGLTRSTSRKKEREEDKQETAVTVAAVTSAEEEFQEESELELNGDTRKTKEKTNPKKNKRSSGDEFSGDDDSKQEDIPEKAADHKKKKSFRVEEESDDISHEESPGDMVRMKSKEKLKDSHEDKPKKKRSRNKKSKTDSDGSPVKIIGGTANEQFEPENAIENPQSKTKTSSTSDKSSKKEKESTFIEDKDEPLGDMSFLINVNSQISVFVADASQDECELEPMTARERNDVYKVTQLYKLRARIGTKAENNLTTVRLSKQADTKMPKPGRVDRLLSELSIVAFKESPKNQAKRKHAATCDGDKQTDGEDPDQEEPPKKKLSKKSRNSKV